MRAARPAACAAILAALWLGTVWADSHSIGATIQYNPRAHEDAEKQVRAFLRENLKP